MASGPMNCADPSLGVREPRCIIPGAVGAFIPIYRVLELEDLASANGANTMNCAVSIACVGLSMRVWLIEWAPHDVGETGQL